MRKIECNMFLNIWVTKLCLHFTQFCLSENGHDDGESTASAGKTVNYDSHDETDSVSSFNPDNGKV